MKIESARPPKLEKTMKSPLFPMDRQKSRDATVGFSGAISLR